MQSLVPSDPRVIGSWRVVGRLGSGGMGIVYLGERDGFRVAIKVVRASFLDDVSLKSRVVREISVLRKIKSLNVASIIEADVSSDFAWFASEFVDGPNLKQFVESSGALNFFQWLKLAEGLFEAFDVIHKQNVIHRDVKPSNILIGPDGPKVIDFGIALTDEATSLTTTGLVAGSPAWLSPEQINDKAITKSSDIFSIGSVLTFAATGNSPWNRENTTKTAVIFHRILTEKPNLQSLNQFQKEFIIKLLDKNPNKRPSAKEAKDLINKEIKRILNQSDKEFQAESELTKIYDRKELTSTEIFKPNKINKSKTNLNKTILVAASFAIFLTAAYFIINNISSNQPKEEIVAQELPQAIQSITSTPIATPTIEEPITEEFAATPTQIPTPKETESVTQTTESKKEVKSLKKNKVCRKIIGSESKCWFEGEVAKIGPCLADLGKYEYKIDYIKSNEVVRTLNSILEIIGTNPQKMQFASANLDQNVSSGMVETGEKKCNYGPEQKTGFISTLFPGNFEKVLPGKVDSVNITIIGFGTIQYIQDVYEWK